MWRWWVCQVPLQFLNFCRPFSPLEGWNIVRTCTKPKKQHVNKKHTDVFIIPRSVQLVQWYYFSHTVYFLLGSFCMSRTVTYELRCSKCCITIAANLFPLFHTYLYMHVHIKCHKLELLKVWIHKHDLSDSHLVITWVAEYPAGLIWSLL